MAVKKSDKAKDGSAAKPKAKAKADGKKSAAKKETAPQKTTTKAAPAAKKAAPKKAAAPIKLTSTQSDLLNKIGAAGEPGYRSEKKAEQRTLDALAERKLIKRGAKHKESGTYHYSVSNAGKKHLGSSSSSSTPTAPSTPPPANPS
jgi:hypothetical protein